MVYYYNRAQLRAVLAGWGATEKFPRRTKPVDIALPGGPFKRAKVSVAPYRSPNGKTLYQAELS